MDSVTDRHDVIVVGGGQAGLAMGYFLARDSRDFTILEAAEEPAAAWRDRWDSLKLFTPVRYSRLPGLPFPGEPEDYPTRDEVAAYLIDYAEHFNPTAPRPTSRCGPAPRQQLAASAHG